MDAMGMDAVEFRTDVLVVGAGAAGMYAAIAAARRGASVILLDKSLIGRGGATVMAQMTVAAAIGHEEPDDWSLHLADTLQAGRGLCDEGLAALLCQQAPERILEMDRWGVGWARDGQRLRQVSAPGHSRRRCVYVDFLRTGQAVAATLQARVHRTPGIRRLSNVAVTRLLAENGRVYGAAALDVVGGRPVIFWARAVILASGGLTKLYRRNSASANMGGDAAWLALQAGAELVDMEFVQFFPIGHLAPRLVGMDPIMWDPFRYKLGGRLLNGRFEEFLDRYGSQDHGQYVAPRDVATYAILKEVEAGRGSPHGGAYLDFRHIPEQRLREAFGPIIDRLLANGIDLTRMPVEVAPIAHYHMGGIRVDDRMETKVVGLYAAGEAVGGAHGANRLSGNAIPEAFVFGHRAGESAAEAARDLDLEERPQLAREALAEFERLARPSGTLPLTPAAAQAELQRWMWEFVGPFRTGAGLEAGLARIQSLKEDLPRLRVTATRPFALEVQDWFDLRAMLEAAEAVARSALGRTESRGAHQREDFPQTDPSLTKRQVVYREGERLRIRWEPVVASVRHEAVSAG